MHGEVDLPHGDVAAEIDRRALGGEPRLPGCQGWGFACVAGGHLFGHCGLRRGFGTASASAHH